MRSDLSCENTKFDAQMPLKKKNNKQNTVHLRIRTYRHIYKFGELSTLVLWRLAGAAF